MHKRDEGFTFIELMVVVIILGILVSIAIPVYSGVQTRAQWGVGESNAKMLNNGFAALQKLQPAVLTVAGTYDGALQNDRDALFAFLSLDHVEFVVWFPSAQRYVADPNSEGFAKGDETAAVTEDPPFRPGNRPAWAGPPENPGNSQGGVDPGPPEWVSPGNGSAQGRVRGN